MIHPLDDAPGQKLYREDLGAMAMTMPVRLSLLALRCYLAGMVALVAWRVISGL